ncbi:hypothetical protein BB559_000481 [Furculomyces boomerangus]|uniref:PITH domain-containing protein n=2 Tax=Harpellales TaxID=61421 RepID=A0A2T9YDC9_9FUNG|nr:hypothetical protein BB559_004668 [Furculomyces boomerangus]PVU99692.1 hypothetical protein BB559_000481 [Furculomyces boomerangus]PVZ96450.1 hypothetical protein BB558_007674 [Smittium angustum]
MENNQINTEHARILANRAHSLYSKINFDLIRCLNETEPESGKTVFKPWDQRLDFTKKVESDCDEELIFHVPFSGQVKLKSILVWGGPGNSAPSKLKVFINREDVDFDNASELIPTQEFDLISGQNEPVEYFTRISKFNNVRNINLYFSSNFDEDPPTTVYYIGFCGEWMQLNNKIVTAAYESKPNLADHKLKLKNEFISRTIQ